MGDKAWTQRKTTSRSPIARYRHSARLPHTRIHSENHSQPRTYASLTAAPTAIITTRASCFSMSSDTAPAPINGNGGGKEDGGGGGEVDAAKVLALHLPLLLTATVVKGFGRGSKLLGIPTGKYKLSSKMLSRPFRSTLFGQVQVLAYLLCAFLIHPTPPWFGLLPNTANLDMEQVGAVVDTWPNGIYFGFAFLRGQIYKAVASIGTNPYFKNSLKVCLRECQKFDSSVSNLYLSFRHYV